jgi:hypothetical protein
MRSIRTGHCGGDLLLGTEYLRNPARKRRVGLMRQFRFL